MGRPKEWLPIGGECLLQRVVRVVSEAVRPVVVAARRGQELPPLPTDVAVVHDAVEDFGPLAGIAAGMDALGGRCESTLVVSCDHPFLPRAIIEKLIESLGNHRAVVVGDGEQLYPLLGVYRMETRSVLEDMIARGEHRARWFAEECGAKVISSEALRAVDPQLGCLKNINDPRSYAEVVESENRRDFKAAARPGGGGRRASDQWSR